MKRELIEEYKAQGRYVSAASAGDELLGPLKRLPGTWKSETNGWNMIALPFEDAPFSYRVLVNHYEETLKFTLVDKMVPNRGISRAGTGGDSDPDQFVVTLDYEQMIKQLHAEDSPDSGKAGDMGLAIHHEPGLWLHMIDERTDDLDIARLSTIPHGDSVLALGRSKELLPPFEVPPVNGLPIGVSQDLGSPDDPADGNPYLAPYIHFHENPFKGIFDLDDFPGFDPVNPHELLNLANQDVDILKTTELMVDTTIDSGGISNIPFIVKQANAAEMQSTFWIHELADMDVFGNARFRLQYLQVVMLDFFPRRDGVPGLIRWPHVSINTLEKTSDTY